MSRGRGGVLMSSRSSCKRGGGLLAGVERRCEGLLTGIGSEDKLLSCPEKDRLSTATKTDHRNLLYH